MALPTVGEHSQYFRQFLTLARSISPEGIGAQTKQIMERGISLGAAVLIRQDQVMKSTCHLGDITDCTAFNEAYAFQHGCLRTVSTL